MLHQNLLKPRRVHGLGKNLFATCFECLLPHLVHGAAGYGNDPRVPEIRLPLQLPRDVVALEIGQSYVEQYHLRAEATGNIQCSKAIDGELHLMAHHPYKCRHGVDRIEVIFDDQHPALRLRKRV